ncbi:methyl-accepting chemotaxis protein [Marinomonas epiphytica]
MSSSTHSLKTDLFVYRALLIQAPILLLSGSVGEALFQFTLVSSLIFITCVQACYSLFKGTRTFSILAGILMMIASSLLIQSQLGLVEMHFHIFASMVLFLIYQTWQPILAALLTTAAYHIGFMYVQMAGVHLGDMPIKVFSGHHSMNIMIVHCVFAASEAVLLCFMANLMTAQSKANTNIANAIEEISDNNNLSIRIEKPTSHAEQSLNNLLERLSELFTDFQLIAQQLGQSSDEIKAVSHETGLNVQSSKSFSLETAAATEEMSQSMKSVSDSSEQSALIAEHLHDNTVKDKGVSLSIMQDMELLTQDTAQAADSLQTLRGDVDSINQLLQAIRSISEQTNLLALNAAIEAARAGETGRGFAVVADEVRALAQRSGDTTDEIERVLEKLNISVGTTVKSMEASKNRTNANVQSVLSISQSLEERSNDVDSLSQHSKVVAENTAEQNIVMQSISEQVSKNAEEIEGIANQMQVLIKNTHKIDNVTKEYQEKASIFTV